MSIALLNYRNNPKSKFSVISVCSVAANPKFAKINNSTKTYVRKIHPFMQNKPNFLICKNPLSRYIKRCYANFHRIPNQKNKPNSNPIKANFHFVHFNITYAERTVSARKPTQKRQMYPIFSILPIFSKVF